MRSERPVPCWCRDAARSGHPFEVVLVPRAVGLLVLRPIRSGHALLIPRSHLKHLGHMPADLAAEIMAAETMGVGQRVARAQKEGRPLPRAGAATERSVDAVARPIRRTRV